MNSDGLTSAGALAHQSLHGNVGYHLIRLEGFLDISRYDEFTKAFGVAPHASDVLVDLSAATGADSVFVTELFLFKRRRSNRIHVLVAPGGMVARVFAIASVADRMSVFTDRERAGNFDSAPADAPS